MNFNKFAFNTNTELFALKVFNSLNRTSSLKSLVCLSAYAGRTVLKLKEKTAHSCLFRSHTGFYFLINQKKSGTNLTHANSFFCSLGYIYFVSENTIN